MGRLTPLAALLLAMLAGLTFSLGQAAPVPAVTAPARPALDDYPWAYLRDGRPLADEERVVDLLIVGDVMLGRGVARENSAEAVDAWLNASGWLAAADLTLGNLEAVLLAEPVPVTTTGRSEPILLSAPAGAVDLLRRAGFDLLGVANNHSLDDGSAGLAESVSHLKRAGLDAIGLASAGEASNVVIRNVNGLRLAFLAFTAISGPDAADPCAGGAACDPQPARWDPAPSTAAIGAARRHADAVIVSVHWGFEYESRPDPRQEQIAQEMLAAGADLVVGHHPHVAQPMTASGSGFVAYSLGNFIFDQGQGDTSNGLALRAFFDGEGLRAVQVLPVHAGPLPRLQRIDEAAELLARVLPPPPRLGLACDGATCVSVPLPPAAASGAFFAGQIDLTGDGTPETVRRAGEQVVVYEAGQAVWRSPETWRIDDVALGDPNNDGRFEIMLALRRRDEAGIERSQPYIIGYRGGRYDLLWGGRPVADPIQELVVGDVDGDGRQELVVIENLSAGTGQAVSVWRWSGWAFTLLWRSAPGRYRDLQLEPGAQPPLSVSQPAP